MLTVIVISKKAASSNFKSKYCKPKLHLTVRKEKEKFHFLLFFFPLPEVLFLLPPEISLCTWCSDKAGLIRSKYIHVYMCIIYIPQFFVIFLQKLSSVKTLMYDTMMIMFNKQEATWVAELFKSHFLSICVSVTTYSLYPHLGEH